MGFYIFDYVWPPIVCGDEFDCHSFPGMTVFFVKQFRKFLSEVIGKDSFEDTVVFN